MAVINGTRYDDQLYGTEEADTIDGKAGIDDIWGREGADLAYGGAGGDVFNGWDNGGPDAADSMYGQTGDDAFNIYAGDNAYGGAGQDTFVLIFTPGQIQGGDGTDTVQIQNNAISAESLRAATGIDQWLVGYGRSYDFTSFTKGLVIEASGGTGTVVTGTNYRDTITLSEEATVHGAGGNDVLFVNGGTAFGDAGRDTLYGTGAATDTFAFNNPTQGIDDIYFFESGQDDIGLDDVGFPGVADGFLFYAASDPLTYEPGVADQAILYDTDDGRLYFDPVAGGNGERQFATLINAPTITQDDFTIL